MTKKIKNFDELSKSIEKAKKRLHNIIIGFFFVSFSPFLLLLIPNQGNLYLFTLDVSASMSGSFDTDMGISKLDVAKDSILKFVEKCSSGDHFVLATYGPGKCEERGLSWIEANPEQRGGKILVDITNDRFLLQEEVVKIVSTESYTHLSEGVFTALDYVDKNISKFPSFRKIEMIIIGDGEDHCESIEPGNNIAVFPWSYAEKLRINTVGIQVSSDEASLNLFSLAEDGNGEHVEVDSSYEFYNKIVEVLTQPSKYPIYLHLIIISILFLATLIILRA